MRGLAEQLVAHMSKDHVWYAKGNLTTDITWFHKTGERYGKRYLPETVGRALRHLEEESVVAVKDDGISVQYKWIPYAMRKNYVPWSRRPVGRKHVLFYEMGKS